MIAQGTHTDDHFLGGRLKILQPINGFRAAIDSVMLPAAISAAHGRKVLDAGAGAGVAALCLKAREPSFEVVALEVDTEAVALAHENAARNNLAVTVQQADLLTAPSAKFDQVMTNPPFVAPGRGTPPPNGAKAQAHMESADLAVWIAACARQLKNGGVLTLVHRADRAHEIISSLMAQFGAIKLFPLWPGPDKPAKRILVQARLGSNAPMEILPGLILHAPGERYTEAAEKILRHGAALNISET